MPSVSIVIPAYNCAAYLRSCLEHLKRSTVQPMECIVVDDGSTDDSADIARKYGAHVISGGPRSGPAHARNVGAKAAKGDILFFIDSDVCVYPNTVAKMAAHFDGNAGLDAVIGSYDDSPKVRDFLSQYRNLMHCYVHQNGHEEACTFWSGCGAIRRSVFLDHSGFDDKTYRRPAIEDIELGYRLKRAGRKMVLDPTMQVKHLKAWSFFELVKTDILNRGVPWTELILRDRFLPNDLNIQLSQRVSVALVFLLVTFTTISAVFLGVPLLLPLLALFFLILSRYEAGSPLSLRYKSTIGTLILVASIVFMAYRSERFELVPPVLLAYVLVFLRHRYSYTSKIRHRITGIFAGVSMLFTILLVVTYFPRHPLVLCVFLLLGALILLNSQFYLFLAARQGRLFALAAIPFHLLFHFYNGISFLVGLSRHYLRTWVSTERKPIPISPKR